MQSKINFSKLLNRAAKKALFIMLATTLLSMTAFVQRTDAQTTYTIGQKAHGGIVFYVDSSGQHGLVAAKEDQIMKDEFGVMSKAIKWYNGVYNKVTGATADGIGAGLMNTMKIFAKLYNDNPAGQYNDNPAGNFAAKVCLDLVVNANGKVYNGWYLPSKHELNLMYTNLHKADPPLGGFASVFYWSSTEADDDEAWSKWFRDVDQDNVKVFPKDSKDISKSIRAVRAF